MNPTLRENLGPESAGLRLDRYLALRLPDLSRTAAAAAVTRAEIRVNGRGVKPSHRLKAGDLVEGTIPDVSLSPIPTGEDLPLELLHEDRQLLVINKPAGLTVHPGAGRRGGTLVNALIHRFPDSLSSSGGSERPGIVHRLDRETSGVLLVARTNAAHRALSKLFREREIKKTYRALVWGAPPDEGFVDRPIGRSRSNRAKMAVDPDGRNALTRFKVVRSNGYLTELEIKPETGRTHQIRVHLASIGHPVVGDETYGGGRDRLKQVQPLFREEAVRLFRGVHRTLLHAETLEFRHPGLKRKFKISAPLPADLKEALARL